MNVEEIIKDYNLNFIEGLDHETQKRVAALWLTSSKNNLSMRTILDEAIPGQRIDGRSEEARLIKKFLAENKFEKTSQPKIELSEIQKEFIRNNATQINNPLEITRILFENASLNTPSAEYKAVVAYLRTLPVDSNKGYDEKDFQPPKNISEACSLLNECISNKYDIRSLKPSQKRQLESLINYLSLFSYSTKYNKFTKAEEKRLFHTTFIRYVYDKTDLTEEEVDKYITVANLTVDSYRQEQLVNILQNRLENVSEDTDGKISIGLTEALDKVNKNRDNILKNLSSSLKELVGTRNDRIKEKGSNNASILNLVEDVKKEESRKRLAQMLMHKNQKLDSEIERIASMDEIRARILGISKEETLYG